MSSVVYLITEGVHDVAFLGRLLVQFHAATRVRKLEALDESLREWLTTAFKWPRFNGKDHDIERLAVPAPVFYRIPIDNVLVVVRAAQGITEIKNTLMRDREALDRLQQPVSLTAIGVVLDSDDEAPMNRYDKLRLELRGIRLELPDALGMLSAGTPRVGAFVLPDNKSLGTLEDVLLSLGDAAYPELLASARTYASTWHKVVVGDGHEDWKDLKKPAGLKKATIGAVTAMLKPGRATAATIEDNRWISDASRAADCLAPCLAFMQALLAPVASAPPAAATSSGTST